MPWRNQAEQLAKSIRRLLGVAENIPNCVKGTDHGDAAHDARNTLSTYELTKAVDELEKGQQCQNKTPPSPDSSVNTDSSPTSTRVP
jgi:hypothetical protein